MDFSFVKGRREGRQQEHGSGKGIFSGGGRGVFWSPVKQKDGSVLGMLWTSQRMKDRSGGAGFAGSCDSSQDVPGFRAMFLEATLPFRTSPSI